MSGPATVCPTCGLIPGLHMADGRCPTTGRTIRAAQSAERSVRCWECGHHGGAHADDCESSGRPQCRSCIDWDTRPHAHQKPHGPFTREPYPETAAGTNYEEDVNR